MQRLVVLIFLCALSAGQVRVPSTYDNGVKWEFGADLYRADVLAHSNFDPAVPTVYKKELLAPIARREPAIAAVYKNPSVVTDVNKPVLPAVYKKEYIVQNVRQHQSVIPPFFDVQALHPNIYKSEPIVQNKYQIAVPIVRKTYPAASNVYQFKNYPGQPVVHLQEQPRLQDFVPKVLTVNSEKQVHPYWNYQYNPHHTFVHGAHVLPHN